MSKEKRSGKEVECSNSLVVVRRPFSKSKRPKTERSNPMDLPFNRASSGSDTGSFSYRSGYDSGWIRVEPERGSICTRRSRKRRNAVDVREADSDLSTKGGDS